MSLVSKIDEDEPNADGSVRVNRSSSPHPELLMELGKMFNKKSSMFWTVDDPAAPVRPSFPMIPDSLEQQRKDQERILVHETKDSVSATVELNTVVYMVGVESYPPANGIENGRAELLNENGEIASWTPLKGYPVTNNQDDGEHVAVEETPSSPGRIRIDAYMNEDSWPNNHTNPIGDTQPDSSPWRNSSEIEPRSLDLHISTDGSSDRFPPLSPQAPSFNPGNVTPASTNSSWPPGLMTMSLDEVKGLHSAFTAATSSMPMNISTVNTDAMNSPSNDDNSNQALVLTAKSSAAAFPRLPPTSPNPYHVTRQSQSPYSQPQFPMSPYDSPLSQRGSPHGGYGSPSYNRRREPPMDQVSKNRRGNRQIDSVDGYVYHVHFKRAPKNFVLNPSHPVPVSIGDVVRVEADRGEDVGTVMSRTLVSDFKEAPLTAGFRGRGFTPAGIEHIRCILGLASVYEKEDLLMKIEEEEIVLQNVREMVIERGIYMSILDVEYQFDHHKLTVFFEADRRVDFRDLVSELFSLYKTRIWMQQVEVDQSSNVAFSLNPLVGGGSQMRSLPYSPHHGGGGGNANEPYRIPITSPAGSAQSSPLNSPGRPHALSSPLSLLTDNSMGTRLVSPASRTALSALDSSGHSHSSGSLDGYVYHQRGIEQQQSFNSPVLDAMSQSLKPDCWYNQQQAELSMPQQARRRPQMHVPHQHHQHQQHQQLQHQQLQQQQMPYHHMPYL